MSELIDVRDNKGQFAPGYSPSRPRGVKNRFSEPLLKAFAEYIDLHGDDANPLITLAKIMADTDEKSVVRVQAAGHLAKTLFPRKIEVSQEDQGAHLRADKMIVSLQQFFGAPPDQKQIESTGGGDASAT